MCERSPTPVQSAVSEDRTKTTKCFVLGRNRTEEYGLICCCLPFDLGVPVSRHLPVRTLAPDRLGIQFSRSIFRLRVRDDSPFTPEICRQFLRVARQWERVKSRGLGSGIASCRDAEPQYGRKVGNNKLGRILWKTVYQNANNCKLTFAPYPPSPSSLQGTTEDSKGEILSPEHVLSCSSAILRA